jgi:CheY-like chemotaxis protein
LSESRASASEFHVIRRSVVQIHSAAVSNRRPFLMADEDGPQLSLVPADLRILIVNEDMGSADLLKRTLRALGYHTTLTAYSAKRALAAAADFSPSVALLDLELPDMTGFQLAHRLRSHLLSCVRRVPLLAVAESLVFGNRELTRAAGFVGCLTKPVLPMELNNLLRRLHGGPAEDIGH